MDEREIRSSSGKDHESHLARELEERVKELNCLFGLSDIVERSGGSLDRILQETAELLPPSWEHAEVACARILLDEKEFRSGNYAASPWVQRAEIRIHGKSAGSIELGYLAARPPRDEGPFMREERKLLEAIAERLGHVVERITAETRLREKEDEFRQRMTHLTRVNTMGEMASGIAHEVNQPLTAIANYAQACRRLVVAEATDRSEVLEVLRRIGEEALRAGIIIRRLRDLVKRRDSELGECAINELINEIRPLASVDARLHDVELDILPSPDLPPICADAIQIQQVLLNLIRNGIDAMVDTPVERRRLEVRSERLDDRHVQVSIRDRGCGLPDEDEELLFEPFFSTKEDGLGIGLSISRSIISLHGGRLWFSRDPGGGTTFSFALPVSGEEKDE